MMHVTKTKVTLFVDRSRQQWIVRDGDGNFWLLPADEDPWERRQPYQPTDAAELEPVPGHYLRTLGLPF